MGMMKRRLEEEEQKRSIAEGIAREARAIRECELHPGTFIDQYNPEALVLAYRIANKRFSEGDETITDHFETRQELTDMIKAVVGESGDECPSCRKWEEE